MLEIARLEELVDAFDPAAHADEITKASEELDQLLTRFPRAEWPEMPLDAYALGQKDHPHSYCWWMEFGAIQLGSIKGGNAKKHLIYFQADASRWWYDDKLYGSVQEAWEAVRAAFVQAIELAQDDQFEAVDSVIALKSGPALVTKTLHVYCPDQVLPVYSHAHLRHFLKKLGEPRVDEPGLGTVTLNRILLDDLRSSGLVDGWSTPRGTARLPATSGIGDAPGKAADVEAPAVHGGRPKLRDRDDVLLRPVALIPLEAVTWVACAQASHPAIAGHLGHDRGGRNGRAGRITANDPLVHRRASAEREVAVHETELRPLPHGAERPLEAGHVGGIDPDPVDLARGDGDDRDRLRMRKHALGEKLALSTPKTLRVVQLLEKIPARARGKPLQVEENPRGHDRAGQAGAAYLVDAGDQANATSAVVGKEG
jgi:hypothetical protein